MKNRTVYDVLDSVMENYSCTIEKEGKKVMLTGKVYIDKIDATITHEKTFYQHGDPNDDYKLESAIKAFKEELRGKVADVIKSHAEELTDDEAMIDKLLYEVKKLTEELQRTKEELASANQRISQLELEKSVQPYQPYPWTTPDTGPWVNPNPWATGITWETQIGDPPGWMDKNNTICSTGEGNTSASYGTGDEVRFNTSEHRKRNPKRFG
jgi:outer membrane murein-binding lipoprotein Lpp